MVNLPQILGHTTPDTEVRLKRIHTAWFHLYEIYFTLGETLGDGNSLTNTHS